MTLRARSRTIEFPRRPLVMGILNINDDSFSGDGRIDHDWALRRAGELIRDGADIIDAGAESARTNRPAISESAEITRLLPFLEGFSAAVAAETPAGGDQVFPPLLSINTWRPAVARAALAVAGDILNDVGGLPGPENARLCAECGAALVIMHTRGAPKIAHTHVRYPDVIGAMRAFFAEKVALALSAGVGRERIILDPGIDFAKQRDDNLTVYRELESITALGFPTLLPVSRKSVIGEVLGLPNPADRDAGTIACIVASVRRGAAILRVHNVRAARLAIGTAWQFAAR